MIVRHFKSLIARLLSNRVMMPLSNKGKIILVETLCKIDENLYNDHCWNHLYKR